MILGVAAALLAGYGVFLLVTAAAGWEGLGARPGGGARRRPSREERMARLGLDSSDLGAVTLGAAAGALAGGMLGLLLFGSALAALVSAACGSTFPVGAARQRRRRRLAAAADAWPRLLEELRTLTGASGRSIPQALFEVGRRAPRELRRGFAVAEREWLLTTDFARTLGVLREQLADPTADVVCETLAVAHQVGGGGLERRLADLIEDRTAEQQGRKDAASKQAGVRFARRFVLLVPLGMAAAGLSIGSGRAAYETAGGQVAVAVGLVAVMACWAWSGRLMRLPAEPRVFTAGQPGRLPS